MKTLALRLMADPLERIRSGKKTVEGRLVSSRMDPRPRDVLEFRLKGNDGDPDLAAEVLAVRRYPEFAAMVAGEGVVRLGFPEMTEEALVKLYRKIYWYPDAEAKRGVQAIEIRPVAAG